MGQKKNLMIGGAVVVLIVVFVSVAIIFNAREWSVFNPQSNEQQRFEAASKAAEEKENIGETGGSADELRNYLDTEPPKVQADQARLKLAAAYLNQQQPDRAIAEYELIGTDNPETKLAVLHGLALAYTDKGDKAKAIEQYRQAIEFMKAQDDQKHAMRIKIDESYIRQLGGQTNE
ncbi:tetratricopeptide repeat protein [Candidatus Saccharibacteria bacterium]|nr:tetratricopeptide repeat protein [Candidatus Saccharibacteria bacterium]